MTYFSTFSGVGGFEIALDALGHTCVGFSEIDAHASAVYRTHFPDHPSYGDIRSIDADALPAFDLFVGGFPCQSHSVAGKRGGLADPRGDLFFDVVRILAAKKPEWFILENVAGLLSSDGGQALGTILGSLVDLGYGVAYRVLDAQNFGVPQRRRRIFLVGHLGDERAGEILALTESLSGDSAPSGEARKDAAADARPGAAIQSIDFRNLELKGDLSGTLQAKKTGGYSLNYTTGVLCATGTRTHALTSEGADASEDGTGRGTPIVTLLSKQQSLNVTDGVRNAIGANDYKEPQVVAFATTSLDTPKQDGQSPPLRVNSNGQGTGSGPSVYVAIPIHDKATRYQGGGDTRHDDGSGNGLGVGDPTDPMYTLSTADKHAVAVVKGAAIGRQPQNGPQYGEVKTDGTCYTLNCTEVHAVAFAQNTRDEVRLIAGDGQSVGALAAQPGMKQTNYLAVSDMPASMRIRETDSVDATLSANGGGLGAKVGLYHVPPTVRRLTPTECERLMSWEDGWTAVGTKPDGTTYAMSDSQRYKMCGNGVVSSVVYAIAARIPSAPTA